MNNIALKFLRVVNEVGSNGWSQIYARMPFGKEEVTGKGALFGAVYSKGSGGTDKEEQILVWADEFYNSVESPGDLAKLWTTFQEKFNGVDAVWVWVTVESGKRKMRVVRDGESGVLIYRGEERAEIKDSLATDKVIAGEVDDGDKAIIWAGEMEKYLPILEKGEDNDEEKADKVIDKLNKDKVGAAGLILKFDKVQDDEEEEVETEIIKEKVSKQENKEENKEENKQGSKEEDKEKQKEELPKEDKSMMSAGPEIYSREEAEDKELIREDDMDGMVSDRLVGPVKPRDKVSNWWRKISSRGGLMVGQERSVKKKKMAVGLGLLFMILLVVSIVFGSIKLKADKEKKQWQSFSDPIEQQIAQAESLGKINQVGSKKILEDAKAAIDAGKAEFENGKFAGDLNTLEQKYQKVWQEVSGEKESQLVNQIDLGLIRQGFNGDRLALRSDGSFMVLDANLGVVASVMTDSKNEEIIAGKGEGAGWIDVTEVKKTGYILTSSGIGTIGSDVTMTPFDSAVAKPVALGEFGANIYVLDQGNQAIYRYSLVSGSIGERIPWLNQGESIEMTPVDMSIDGDIWLVGGGNEIDRYRRGAAENFAISGGPENAKYIRISVQQDGDNLAVLDKEHGWIVIFKKDGGTFVSQLVNEKFKQASDIEYDSNGKLWVLTSGTMAEAE